MSSSCLRLHADGKILYAAWWNSAATITDQQTGKKSRPEHLVSKEFTLDKFEVSALSDFLHSKAVRKLPEIFGPPHQPIDYVERVIVQITGANGKSKQISTREYFVADLEEKTRYPSALIVLMEQIRELEEQVQDKGKPAETPPDCHLKPPWR